MSPTKDECEHILGERFYGFGHWDAPYWFIGPEQGQDRSENNDLMLRCKAFIDLECDGLCDCRKFHEQVDLEATTQWYRPRSNGKVPLQKTWCKLMKILFAFKSDQKKSRDQLVSYQLKHLGSTAGETCLVEANGLPANNAGVDRNRSKYLEPRLDQLVNKINENKNDIRFVVIYRTVKPYTWDGYQKLWTERFVKNGAEVGVDEIWHLGKCRIIFTHLPLAQSDAELIRLGHKLRTS